MHTHLDYVTAVEAALAVHGVAVTETHLGNDPVRHAVLVLDDDETAEAFPQAARVELCWTEEAGWYLKPYYAPHTGLDSSQIGCGFAILAQPDRIARWVDVALNTPLPVTDHENETRRAGSGDDFENRLRAWAIPAPNGSSEGRA
jgi:hypothetical protein